jgi:hypothetical protein
MTSDQQDLLRDIIDDAIRSSRDVAEKTGDPMAKEYAEFVEELHQALIDDGILVRPVPIG